MAHDVTRTCVGYLLTIKNVSHFDETVTLWMLLGILVQCRTLYVEARNYTYIRLWHVTSWHPLPVIRSAAVSTGCSVTLDSGHHFVKLQCYIYIRHSVQQTGTVVTFCHALSQMKVAKMRLLPSSVWPQLGERWTDFYEIRYWGVSLKRVHTLQFWSRSDNNNEHVAWGHTVFLSAKWLGGESRSGEFPCHLQNSTVKFWRKRQNCYIKDKLFIFFTYFIF